MAYTFKDAYRELDKVPNYMHVNDAGLIVDNLYGNYSKLVVFTKNEIDVFKEFLFGDDRTMLDLLQFAKSQEATDRDLFVLSTEEDLMQAWLHFETVIEKEREVFVKDEPKEDDSETELIENENEDEDKAVAL